MIKKLDFEDLILLIGIAMLGYGLYLISLPLALIIVGTIFIIPAFLTPKGNVDG